MDIITLSCHSLVKTQGRLSFEDIGAIVENYEEQVFEDGYYKNGPTIVEFSLDDVTNEEQEVSIYLPVNNAVESGENYSWVEDYQISQAVRERVPFLSDLEPALVNLKSYLDNEGLDNENKLLLAFIKVYDEYWVDIILPFKEQNND